MRRGEIFNLVWQRVDFKEGLIQLKAEDTKTKKGRIVPLTPELTTLLRRLYKVRYLQEPHVFLERGKSLQSTKTAISAACLRAQVTGFRFHDFRHTALTNMRRAEIDYLTIMKISGHKTMAGYQRYDSVDIPDLKEAARRLNTLLLTLGHQVEKDIGHNA